ncbi:MAG: Tripartite DNA replication factor [Thelocarpon impressellum]|nr:MAG: Tripartite DNA replication factor [Thelocarpon impressellum]
MTAPLPAVSSQSKSKLQAFTFAGGNGDKAEDAGESVVREDDGTSRRISGDAGLSKEACRNPSTQETASKAPKDHPQTPASRLPLAELIGTSDENAVRSSSKEVSPDERVFWEHSRSSDSSTRIGSMVTPGATARRGKKRARSSSPAPSPQGASTHPSAGKKSFDLDPLHKSLRTPQTNPADELWNRYAVDNGAKPTSCGPIIPTFAHLLNNSSPRSNINATPALRRSASCGMEWPMSKAKKMKHSGQSGADESAGVFSAGRQEESPSQGKSKPSRNDLDRKSVSGEGPESSEGADAERQDVGSDGRSSAFGDFDDDDINMSLLEAADLAEVTSERGFDDPKEGPAADRPHQVSMSPTNRRGSAGPAKDASAGRSEVGLGASLSTDAEGIGSTGSSDEFGDDGEDIDAADFEDAAAQYDTGPSSRTGTVDGDGGVVPTSQASRPAGDGVLIRSVGSQSSTGGASKLTAVGTEVLEEDFGDVGDFDFELAAAEVAESQRPPSPRSSSRNARAIKRYLITSVAEGQYETPRGQPPQLLLVEDEKTRSRKGITLRQSWFDSPCTTGAYVHLIGDFARDGRCIVDDAQNTLIIHPDHLISSTVVADSFGCTRRAVLQDRVKASNEASPPQVYGHILHEIFQEAMKANRWDTQWLTGLIEKVVMRYIESIYEIKIEVEEAVRHLKSKVPGLQAWAEVFVSAKPRPEAVVKDRNGKQALMSINKLLDVEEHVWSPMYGLKGNIDATVQITVDEDDGCKTLTVPFELKTGKNTANSSHRAQTALYTLLLSDRYDIEVVYGILYYMETSDVSRVPAIRHELRHMIMQRNELACYVRDRLELPPMLKNSHMCGRCYAKVPCFIYHRLMDDGTGETTGLKDKFDEVVRHLRPEHQTFFKNWDTLLTKEETEMLRFRRELWTMLSSEREKLGRCFANVVIEPGSAHEAEDAPKINRFRYTLLKQMPAAGFSFVDSQLAVGEPIVISDERGHFALANGYVTHVRKRRIAVAVDRRLHNARVRQSEFDAAKNQTFAGIMEVEDEGKAPSNMTRDETEEQVLYRLDKDEFSNGMATARNNLIQAMADGPFGSREIRSLVVELKAPAFRAISTPYTLPGGSSPTVLNVDQERAIEKVMSAKDYALVLGMPGTGKTTTIAHIIRALVSQGKSVLLTSYTHNAVDNILLKIRRDNIGILRLGAVAKVHREVQEFAILAGEPKKTIEEVHEAFHGPKVVATTCLGVNHAVFNERVFDYCIVDEASQITLPVCLGPIRMAKTFVLVGDHNQLPPLVQNAEAREGGLDISLFKLLSDKHPGSVVNLEHQYRMCEEIMTLSNTLIYDGLLKCGNESVAKRSLAVPKMDALGAHHRVSMTGVSSGAQGACERPVPGSCWLRDLLDPAVKACFINTDPLLPGSREDARGSRIVNSTEASLCTQLVEALLSTGVSGSDIGVISVYRSQLALLKHGLRHRGASAGVELHTADRFQGRDKEVVIVSLVRSNEARNVGELLRDWRRVNVAFTRARSKLLVVGSRSTLASDALLGRFLDLMAQRKWVYDLPPGAVEAHVFEEVTTQGSLATSPGAKPTVATSPSKKENIPPQSPSILENGGTLKAREGPKQGRLSARAILGSRPVLRDILNDLS